MHQDLESVLISTEELASRVADLGQKISTDYQGQDVLLVGILKGATVFLVDLMRSISIPVEIDFMAISSYGVSTESSGVVQILKDLDGPVAGKHVLIVEDIVDTGLTLDYILRNLGTRRPASVRVCGLLMKEKARSLEAECHYVGFRIPDRFVVGYGLDYAERYRNLPYIGVLKRSVYAGQE